MLCICSKASYVHLQTDMLRRRGAAPQCERALQPAVLARTAAPVDSLRSGHIGKCAGGLVDGSGTNCTTARRLEAAVL